MSPSRHVASVRWSGSTGAGWEAYEREHLAEAAPAAQAIRMTTGESHGDPSLLNPEQLVVMAASSCQMLVFLHLAAKARLDVVGYEDEAAATMAGEAAEPDRPGAGPGRIAAITLRPRITLRGASRDGGEAADDDAEVKDRGRVERLVELAHEHCYVANSLSCEMLIEPSIETDR